MVFLLSWPIYKSVAIGFLESMKCSQISEFCLFLYFIRRFIRLAVGDIETLTVCHVKRFAKRCVVDCVFGKRKLNNSLALAV